MAFGKQAIIDPYFVMSTRISFHSLVVIKFARVVVREDKRLVKHRHRGGKLGDCSCGRDCATPTTSDQQTWSSFVSNVDSVLCSHRLT